MSPLPDERNTTYEPDSQVKSVDLNDFQDQIVILHSDAHGERERDLNLFGFHLTGGIAFGSLDRISATTDDGTARTVIPLRVGDRLKKILVRVLQFTGSGQAELNLYRKTGAASLSLVDNLPLSSAGSKQLVLTPATKVTDVSYYLEVETVEANGQVDLAQFSYIYDRPA